MNNATNFWHDFNSPHLVGHIQIGQLVEFYDDDEPGDGLVQRARVAGFRVSPHAKATLLVECEPVGEIERRSLGMDDEPTLMARHMTHYRSCGCLDDSAECCVTSCACHASIEEPSATPLYTGKELRPQDSVGYVAFDEGVAEDYWGDVW